MKKRTYIQPKMVVAVLPQDALMDEIIALAGSPTMGTVGAAPKRVADPVRRTEVF